MARKDFDTVNDQGPSPKMTNTGLKNLAKTGSLYKNDCTTGCECDRPMVANNQPPEHK